MNNTEDPFLEDMNWINRTCKKSKKSMSETEINEDNCVLSIEELAFIEVTFEEKYVTHGDTYTEMLFKILKKIAKLNDLAKEKQK